MGFKFQLSQDWSLFKTKAIQNVTNDTDLTFEDNRRHDSTCAPADVKHPVLPLAGQGSEERTGNCGGAERRRNGDAVSGVGGRTWDADPHLAWFWLDPSRPSQPGQGLWALGWVCGLRRLR